MPSALGYSQSSEVAAATSGVRLNDAQVGRVRSGQDADIQVRLSFALTTDVAIGKRRDRVRSRFCFRIDDQSAFGGGLKGFALFMMVPPLDTALVLSSVDGLRFNLAETFVAGKQCGFVETVSAFGFELTPHLTQFPEAHARPRQPAVRDGKILLQSGVEEKHGSSHIHTTKHIDF